MQTLTVLKDNYSITTDRCKMDLKAIYDYLSIESYWSKGIPLETFKTSVKNSLNFGVFHQNKQIGFARIISDFATMAYLADVYILTEHRGKGLSKWLMEIILSHPDLQGLRRWILLTKDAHELYKKFGWKELKDPSKYLELHDPDVYNS